MGLRKEREKRKPPERRGMPGQFERRQAERSIRRHLMALTIWAMKNGVRLKETAERLGLLPETLWSWVEKWDADRMKLMARGRPADRGKREERNEALAMFLMIGPDVGVESLREHFPDLSRAEMREIVKRARKAIWGKGRLLLRVLRWPKAGRVWSMDFFEPPCLIDGIYRYVLLVRDLGSRKLLSALPTVTMNASAVVDLLTALVAWYGAPLVSKSDNGSPLVEEGIQRFWESCGTRMLLSPPYYPKYNGSAECGGGTMQVKAFFHAALEDRPEAWDCGDIEFAKRQANDTVRRDLPYPATPDQLFEERRPISDEEREEFRQCYYEHEFDARRELGFFQGIELSLQEQARVDRVALSKALLEKGYLQFRRRRITTPICVRKVERIS
jgi:transposase InsO family protein